MPACQVFGAGWHVRPLLGFTRSQLEEWARVQQLAWLEDPSNQNNRFSRNYLRHEVIPALRRRWPDAAASARRSAVHLGEAGRLLATMAMADMQAAAVGPCLRVAALSALDPGRRRNLLRYWLRTRGARAPSTQKLAALEHDMVAAQEDRSPCVDWEGFEVRRHRGLLYGGVPLPEFDPARESLEWNLRDPLLLPNGSGILRPQTVQGAGLAIERLPTPLRVGYRRGGETLRPAGHAHHRALKKLLQEADILPWWRERIPLLLAGRKVAAVGDLWVAEQYAARGDEPGVKIVWEGRPALEAVIR
jgi:tRNA(Ile)-lysidine synthase